ncbi:MAG: hypothetical protein ACYDHN_16835 [Solirubrobacteraceae bacterium]
MSFRQRLSSERGDALISGLLALGLVLLVIAVAVQALAYAHARSVAQAAAQDGAEAAASEGNGAGIARADALLAAAGGTGAHLHPDVQSSTSAVTVLIEGSAPQVFPGAGLLLPAVKAKASEPLERYPQDETHP